MRPPTSRDTGPNCVLQEIIKAQGRASNSAGECYIDPESLREEFQRSLVAKISSRQASVASLMYPVSSSILTQQLLLILTAGVGHHTRNRYDGHGQNSTTRLCGVHGCQGRR